MNGMRSGAQWEGVARNHAVEAAEWLLYTFWFTLQKSSWIPPWIPSLQKLELQQLPGAAVLHHAFASPPHQSLQRANGHKHLGDLKHIFSNWAGTARGRRIFLQILELFQQNPLQCHVEPKP
nr:hypothetical protein Iba_chr13eCG9700 [Ipomoea batatas]